eukprot:GEMP01063708.1.p1 GENE.GEMP01063708.1~~GEMP01063708.1.p1  ORF type:complete len:354 (+),score=81.33 GEMP01063708.1:51-1112(+)
MPITSKIHVFASHKGGTGKTMLSFNAASSYAANNPECKVAVFDMTELGDLSKRCLGGSKMSEQADEVLGSVFDIIYDAKQHIKEQSPPGVFSKIGDMFRSSNHDVSDLLENAVHCSEYNSAMPENLYLFSSGASTFGDEERPLEEMLRISDIFRRAFEQSKDAWRIFIDTDGDRRPAPFTKLAYALGERIIVPLQPDEADFNRLEQMISTLAKMKSRGELNCRVQLVAWNKLQLYKHEACDIGAFTTPKVTTDMVRHLNAKLYKLAQQTGNLFVHCDSPNLAEFTRSSTTWVCDFPDTVARPSNSQGIPFCQMVPGKITISDGLEFAIKKEQIDGCKENIQNLLNTVESMEVE